MRILVGCALLFGVTVGSGCSGPSAESLYSEVANSNAKRLGALYFQYQVRNTDQHMRGPASVDEFKQFVSGLDAKRLEVIGVDVSKLEELFVSPRDNQPYKIRLEVQGVVRGPTQPVVFEETGVDGKRMVAFTGFIEKEVEQNEYDRLWSGDADDGE